MPRRRGAAGTLGEKPLEEHDGGLRYEGAAGVFCLFASAGASDGSFTQMAFYVDDIEAAVAGLRARGVVTGRRFERSAQCRTSVRPPVRSPWLPVVHQAECAAPALFTGVSGSAEGCEDPTAARHASPVALMPAAAPD